MSCCQLILHRLCQSYLYPKEPAEQTYPSRKQNLAAYFTVSLSWYWNIFWRKSLCVSSCSPYTGILCHQHSEGRLSLQSGRPKSYSSLACEKFPLIRGFSLKHCGLLNHFKHRKLPLWRVENIKLYGLLPAVGSFVSVDHAGPLSVLRFVSLSSEVHLEIGDVQYDGQLQAADT